jgi:hypothetical protein
MCLKISYSDVTPTFTNIQHIPTLLLLNKNNLVLSISFFQQINDSVSSVLKKTDYNIQILMK